MSKAKNTKPAAPKKSAVAGVKVQLGPTKPVPGSRLKKKGPTGKYGL